MQKSPLQIQTAMMSDILRAFLVLTFVMCGIGAVFIAYDRQIERECTISQEYRPCR